MAAESDIGAQLNIWRIIAVSEKRDQDIANQVFPGLGHLLGLLIVFGQWPRGPPDVVPRPPDRPCVRPDKPRPTPNGLRPNSSAQRFSHDLRRRG